MTPASGREGSRTILFLGLAFLAALVVMCIPLLWIGGFWFIGAARDSGMLGEALIAFLVVCALITAVFRGLRRGRERD